MNLATQIAINTMNTVATMNAINTMNQTNNALRKSGGNLHGYVGSEYDMGRPKLDDLPILFLYIMLHIVCGAALIGLPFLAYGVFMDSEIAIGIIVTVCWLAMVCIECAIAFITKDIVDDLKKEIKARKWYDKCEREQQNETKDNSIDSYVEMVVNTKPKSSRKN